MLCCMNTNSRPWPEKTRLMFEASKQANKLNSVFQAYHFKRTKHNSLDHATSCSLKKVTFPSSDIYILWIRRISLEMSNKRATGRAACLSMQRMFLLCVGESLNYTFRSSFQVHNLPWKAVDAVTFQMSFKPVLSQLKLFWLSAFPGSHISYCWLLKPDCYH